MYLPCIHVNSYLSIMYVCMYARNCLCIVFILGVCGGSSWLNSMFMWWTWKRGEIWVHRIGVVLNFRWKDGLGWFILYVWQSLWNKICEIYSDLYVDFFYFSSSLLRWGHLDLELAGSHCWCLSDASIGNANLICKCWYIFLRRCKEKRSSLIRNFLFSLFLVSVTCPLTTLFLPLEVGFLDLVIPRSFLYVIMIIFFWIWLLVNMISVEVEKQSFCDLKVVNNTEHHVAFKVPFLWLLQTCMISRYVYSPSILWFSMVVWF